MDLSRRDRERIDACLDNQIAFWLRRGGRMAVLGGVDVHELATMRPEALR